YFHPHRPHHDLHSFPTRRSSDLNQLFQVGKFAEAGKLYSQIATQNPKDYSATLQVGRIALLSNRLDDAQKWLEKAITLQPVGKRSEEHTSELQSRFDLVCRLLLE